jgi:hypothetical protein
MSDDLVTRLRERDAAGGDYCTEWGEAADRIEKLEAELHSCFHRIEELQAALREIGRTFLAEVKSKPEQWTSKQSLLLSHEQAVEVHEELGRRILIARKALDAK